MHSMLLKNKHHRPLISSAPLLALPHHHKMVLVNKDRSLITASTLNHNNYKEEIRTYRTEYRNMDEEDQDKVQWMRSVYREVPLDSPVLNSVKASNVHQQLKLRYAVQCSHHREAGLVQRAFPNVESKVAGKSRSLGTGARCLCLLCAPCLGM